MNRTDIESDAQEMVDFLIERMNETYPDPRDRRIFMREVAKRSKIASEVPIIRINLIHLSG